MKLQYTESVSFCIFTYIEDVVSSNMCAMNSKVNHGIYNVGTGKRTSLKQLAELIIDITKTSQTINYSSSSQKTLVRNRIGCPKKASKEIKFVHEKQLEESTSVLEEKKSKEIEHICECKQPEKVEPAQEIKWPKEIETVHEGKESVY